jgi:hypothetical protein
VRLFISKGYDNEIFTFMRVRSCQTTYSVFEGFPFRSYAGIYVDFHGMESIYPGSFISRSCNSSYRLCMELVLGSKVVINVA